MLLFRAWLKNPVRKFQSMLLPTAKIKRFIVRLITDGQVAVTVQLEATFKDMLESADRCINIVLEKIVLCIIVLWLQYWKYRTIEFLKWHPQPFYNDINFAT